MKVKVLTTPLEAGASHTVKVIDWTDSSDRKWLTNHQHWAMNNGQAVMISPESN